MNVAVGQIMKYYRWPYQGRGSHSYTDTASGLYRSANFENRNYNWSIMPDMLDSNSSQTEIDEISTLLSDITIALESNLESFGTFSDTFTASDALYKYFKYMPSQYVGRIDFTTDAQWFNIFKEDLDYNRVSFLSLFASSNDGHAAVIDGYKIYGTLRQLHLNMGWGGSDNSWYTMNNIIYTSQGNFDDILGQEAVVGITKDTKTKYLYYYDNLDTRGCYIGGYGQNEDYGAVRFEPENSGKLTHIAFYTSYPTVNYEVELYKGSNISNAIGSSLLFSKSGTATTTGWHYVEPTNNILINSGNNYYVVIKFSKNSTESTYYLISYDGDGKGTGHSYVGESKNSLELRNDFNILIRMGVGSLEDNIDICENDYYDYYDCYYDKNYKLLRISKNGYYWTYINKSLGQTIDVVIYQTEENKNFGDGEWDDLPIFQTLQPGKSLTINLVGNYQFSNSWGYDWIIEEEDFVKKYPNWPEMVYSVAKNKWIDVKFENKINNYLNCTVYANGKNLYYNTNLPINFILNPFEEKTAYYVKLKGLNVDSYTIPGVTCNCIDTSYECEAIGYFWYNNTCNKVASTTTIGSNEQWAKTYGGLSYDYGKSIQQTDDGGFIVAGLTSSFGAGKINIWIIKLDKNGAIQWQKTYGGLNYDYADSIQQTSDGGFIIAGFTSSFGAGKTDIWILKLDSIGNIKNCDYEGTSNAIVNNTSANVLNTNIYPKETSIKANNSNAIQKDTTATSTTQCYYKESSNNSDNVFINAAPKSPLSAFLFKFGISQPNPQNTLVEVPAVPNIIIQPSLQVDSEDIGKKAELIIYIFIESTGEDVTLSKENVILSSTQKFTIISYPIDLSNTCGLTADIYYGYQIGDNIKYNAYEVKVVKANQ